jgi:paired amphipathic helix protein Sin3a
MAWFCLRSKKLFFSQDFSILDDANNLLIHHVKRQTSIHKEDKHKIKVLLKHFLMDQFKHPRQEMSDDERDDDDEEEAEAEEEAAKGGSRTRCLFFGSSIAVFKFPDAYNG